MIFYKRVLLIDDDPVNNHLSQFVIKRFFEGNNVDIISFTDPKAGFEYVANNYSTESVSTILLLDLNMPVLTGWDVLDKLKELSSDILKNFTVLILSSSVDAADIKRAESNPLVKGFISKPLTRHAEPLFHEFDGFARRPEN